MVSLISNNYVEEVDLDDVMHGALRGLTEGLDAESAYLSQEDVDRLESGRPLPEGGVGLTVTRRYYVQVVAAHDGSPAADAGILPGDFLRAIDGEPTRRMSAIEGERRLRGEPGSTVTLSLIRGSTQEPFDIDLVRTRVGPVAVAGRVLNEADGIGYIRIPGFGDDVVAQISDMVASLTERGASHLNHRRPQCRSRHVSRGGRCGAAVRRRRHTRHSRGARRQSDPARGDRGRRCHFDAGDGARQLWILGSGGALRRRAVRA